LDRHPRAWSAADWRFLQEAARLLARAIRRDDDTMAARRVRRYADAAAACAQDLVDPACDADTAAAAATLRHALAMLEAAEGCVLVLAPARRGDRERPRLLAGTPGMCEGLGVPPSVPLGGVVLPPLSGQARLLLHTRGTGLPLHTSDVQRHPAALGKAPLLLAGAAARQLVAAPITLDGQVVGQLTLARASAPRFGFRAGDARALGTLASQLAVALGRLARPPLSAPLGGDVLSNRRDELIARFAAGVVRHVGGPVFLTRAALQRVNADLLGEGEPGEDGAGLAAREAEAHLDRAAAVLDRLDALGGERWGATELVDPAAALRGFEGALREVAGASHPLVLEAPDALPAVPLEAAELREVVAALVDNAARASEPGARIEVGLAREELAEPEGPVGVALGSEPSPATLHLWVQDRGAGMSQETSQRATEPFFTTGGWADRVGLGLTQAAAYARRAGGRLEVESALGHGTTVHLYLPAPAVVSATPPSTGTVLVVESDAMLGRLMRRVLEGAGHRVLLAGDPPTALTAAAQHDGPIHALVVDAAFPLGTAWDVLDALHQTEGRRLPALIVSGALSPLVLRAEGAGPDVDFLPLPLQASDLVARVQALVERSQASAPER